METKKLTKNQRNAILYLEKGYTIRNTAKILGIRVSRIQGWMEHNVLFKNILEKRLISGNDQDAEYRKRNNLHYLERVYEAIHKRIKEPEVLNDMELKELFGISRILATEIRLDDSSGKKGNEGDSKNNIINIFGDDVRQRFLERANIKELTSVIDTQVIKEDSDDGKKEETERLH